MRTFRKERPDAPIDFFRCEAAGLQWLGSTCGAPCVEVLDVGAQHLVLDRLTETEPTRQLALEFGAGLARTHDAGAPAFGSPPEGWSGPGYFGPLSDPLPMAYADEPTWGVFYAVFRLQPLLELPRAMQAFSEKTRRLIEAAIDRLLAGDFDDGDAPARIHGDLWSGNLMWTSSGATLIDSAAHGGHRETDLAFLSLFGCPFLDSIVEGYEQVHVLQAGWRERVPLHQLYPLMVHAILFGGGYESSTAAAARAVLEL